MNKAILILISVLISGQILGQSNNSFAGTYICDEIINSPTNDTCRKVNTKIDMSRPRLVHWQILYPLTIEVDANKITTTLILEDYTKLSRPPLTYHTHLIYKCNGNIDGNSATLKGKSSFHNLIPSNIPEGKVDYDQIDQTIDFSTAGFATVKYKYVNTRNNLSSTGIVKYRKIN